MPTLQIGQFSKRINSTKQPNMTDWDQIDYNYKNPTSIRNPVLDLATDNVTYTYAYIPDFGRYYFVTDVERVHTGLTRYTFACDTMGSHKTEIASTSARIAFSTTGWSKYLPDPRLGVYATIDTYPQTAASGLNNGAIILTTAQDNDGIAYYAMNDANVGHLIQCLMDSNIGNKIRQMMNDPMQSILSCVWVPYIPNDLPSVNVRVADELLNGNYGLPAVSGGWIGPYNKIHTLPTVSLNIPFKCQDFRDLAPYTQFTLYLPGIGCIDLNPNDFVESATVNIITTTDITTGDIIYRIFNDKMELLQTVSFAGGVPVPISGTSTNMKGAIAGIAGMVGAAAGIAAAVSSGGSAAPAAGALIISGANAALNANMKSTSFKGSNGSRVDFTDSLFTLLVSVKDTEDPTTAAYIANKGRPVCQSGTIGSYSGFVQCDEASVIISGFDWEREEINGYLNSGFFFE